MLQNKKSSNGNVALATVCRPVAKVGRLLNALQNYLAVNRFKSSITKVIFCLEFYNTLLLQEYR